MEKTSSPHYPLLTHFVRNLVTDRYKNLAKDEKLFRFLSDQVEPALLIDHSITAEREGMDLAEMSLLKLVDTTRMSEEVARTAERVQRSLSTLLGFQIGAEYMNAAALNAREKWLLERVVFYRRFLSLKKDVSSPLELAQLSFRSRELFESALEPLIRSEEELYEELLRHTPALHRFLMKKHWDLQLEVIRHTWEEFSEEAFKETKKLT